MPSVPMVTQPSGESALANLTGALGGIAMGTLVGDLAALTTLPAREEASPTAGVGIEPEPPYAAAAPLGALAVDTEFMSGSPTFGTGGATLGATAWDIEMSQSDLVSSSDSGSLAAETPGTMEEMQLLHEKYLGLCQAAFQLKRWEEAERSVSEIEKISAEFLSRKGACLSPDQDRYVMK